MLLTLSFSLQSCRHWFRTFLTHSSEYPSRPPRELDKVVQCLTSHTTKTIWATRSVHLKYEPDQRIQYPSLNQPPCIKGNSTRKNDSYYSYLSTHTTKDKSIWSTLRRRWLESIIAYTFSKNPWHFPTRQLASSKILAKSQVNILENKNLSVTLVKSYA